MRKFVRSLFPFLFLYLISCATIPVTDYNTAEFEKGINLGLDLSKGRDYASQIDFQGYFNSQDSIYKYSTTYLLTLTGRYNLNQRLSFKYRTAVFPFSGFQAMGLEYVLNPKGKFSEGVAITLATTKSSGSSVSVWDGHSDTTRFSFKTKSVLTSVYLSYPIFTKSQFMLIPTTGIKFIYCSLMAADSIRYNFPEFGLFTNLRFKIYLLNIVPEICIMSLQSPDKNRHFGIFPGIFVGLGK
jgi:hypothetical protein